LHSATDKIGGSASVIEFRQQFKFPQLSPGFWFGINSPGALAQINILLTTIALRGLLPHGGWPASLLVFVGRQYHKRRLTISFFGGFQINCLILENF